MLWVVNVNGELPVFTVAVCGVIVVLIEAEYAVNPSTFAS